MIKVLHTIDTTGPGGAETIFVNLLEGLDTKRFESFAAITGTGWVCDTLRKKSIEPIFIQSRGGFNYKYLMDLIRIIRIHKIDIIQSHLIGSNLYCSLAGLICQIPVISTFHGFVDTNIKDRLMPIKSSMINLGSKKIVFVSDHLRKYFIRHYGFSAAKSITIYNGVDTSIFHLQRDNNIKKQLGLGPEHILIGAVGNIRQAKGYDYLLKASRLVIDEHPECRFIIAGQRSGNLYEELLNLRKELGLDEAVFFIGFMREPYKLLNNLDIFVLSSISEGFSLSTIEAMLCGIPVVVTRSGGPEEIVVDGINGVMVETQDDVALAHAIIKTIKESKFNDKTTDVVRKSISKKFSIYRMVEKYENNYLNALS